MLLTFYASLQKTGFQWQVGKLATRDVKADSKCHDIIIPAAKHILGVMEYVVNDAQHRDF